MKDFVKFVKRWYNYGYEWGAGLIEKAIKDGRRVIVNKIRAAESVEEIDATMPEVEN